jgi:hypothetical protein
MLKHLKMLPLRALAVFAARCARRIQPRAVPSDDQGNSEECRPAVSGAIQVAEDFAQGMVCPVCESVIRPIETIRDQGRHDLARQDAIASAQQAAYTAATALNALDT